MGMKQTIGTLIYNDLRERIDDDVDDVTYSEIMQGIFSTHEDLQRVMRINLRRATEAAADDTI